MKTLITLLFFICLCCSRGQFVFTNLYMGISNNSGTGDGLNVAGPKINTNFYYSTNLIGIISNAVVAASNILQTANSATSNSLSAGPSQIWTNWVSGALYTNLSGRLQFNGTEAVTTHSTVAGAAIQRLLTGPQGAALTNVAGYGAQTIIGSLGTTNVGNVCGPIPNGWVFSFSNSVAGAGDAAANLPGTGYQITY